ncbi:MAG: hypothetical protein K0U86_17990 [Planctomycetes bacterium]|nr:hypothetical protein [Planctomycetota bacterium]MCH9726798.1 hypothetical protein [Planctomycetota bacterium]MCH9775042.1 hypothetical protein [Planctomycetota bacterium]MCH9791420.1 hypothetical protein [Planctomycetota bacterium]
MHPPGGQAGQSTDVILGGYDWTPDMKLFVHDKRIKLKILSQPGPIIVPEPPYWFGKKARRAPFLLPRETRARLTIPANIPPGVVRWQAANANGATASGNLIVSHGPELLEIENPKQTQTLSKIPITVSGQIKKIEEVDRYRFIAEKTGPVSCSIVARKLGSPLNATLEIHDVNGRKIASAIDTAGNDSASITFSAQAKQSYTISVYDADFRGNRKFVYRLSITAAPRVVAAIPAAGRRGETRLVELVGFGVATGASKLESVMRKISFPTDKSLKSFPYQLKTPYGISPAFSLLVSDLTESVEKAEATPELKLPAAITGVLNERFGNDVYQASGKKGDLWSIHLSAEEIASPLDVELTVRDSNGKELARNDDIPGSTDAALHFKVPTDAKYQLVVSDISGLSGQKSSVYRMTIRTTQPSFRLTVPELLNAPLGKKIKLALKAIRSGGLNEPVLISLMNLPPGITTAKELIIPAGKSALSIELDVAANTAASAALVTVVGQAKTKDKKTVRFTSSPVLIATTIQPPFTIDAEGKDDVTKWPRGTTFPAPVLIKRNPGFKGGINLEMTSRQGRHRQGIRGPELTVPPSVERILYPVFLPEWLETTRTSRMVVNGVAKVTDPKGNVRYSLTRQKTRMGFLPTGALLKISSKKSELKAIIGKQFIVPVKIQRSQNLMEPVRLELLKDHLESTSYISDTLEVASNQSLAAFPITVNPSDVTVEESKITIRATALQNGTLPVVSETTVILQLSK